MENDTEILAFMIKEGKSGVQTPDSGGKRDG